MSTRDVPEPWAARMIRVGLVDRRNGRPSMTRLAEAADTHPSTISAMMYGTRATKPEIIDRVAVALWPESTHAGRRRRDVYDWVGRALSENAPFEPHPDADLLNAKERQAINEVIRLMAAGKKAGSNVVHGILFGPSDDELDESAHDDADDAPPIRGGNELPAAAREDEPPF